MLSTLRRRAMAAAVLLSVLLGSAAITSAAFSVDDLAGTWVFHSLSDAQYPYANNPGWTAGTIVVNASGTVTGGSVTDTWSGGPTAVTEGALSIDGGGGVTGWFATGAGRFVFIDSGQLDGSKTHFTGTGYTSASQNWLGVATKAGGSFATPDLAGTWAFHSAADEPYPYANAPGWMVGTIVVNASGTVTGGSVTDTWSGGPTAVTGGALSIDGGGAVTGWFTIGVTNTITIAKGKLDGSKTHLSGVGSNSVGYRWLGVATKAGGSFATADLAGTWAFHSLTDAPYPYANNPGWAKGAIVVNASGTVTGGTLTDSWTGGSVTGGTLSIDGGGAVTGWFATGGGKTIAIANGKLDGSKTHFTGVGTSATGYGWFGVGTKKEVAATGTSKVGTFRPSDGAFYLDYNGNGVWDGCGTDRCLSIGLNGDIPLVGDWEGSGTTLFDTAPAHTATLSTWQLTTPLPVARASHAMTATTTHVYVLGGGTPTSCTSDSVIFAPMLPDGNLGAWTPTTSLTFPRTLLGAAVVGKWLYVVGGASGCDLVGDTKYATVERAEIFPDGTLGPWVSVASLTHGRAHMPVVTDGLHLYAVGGYDGSRTDSVDMTTVLPDGSLAAWQPVAGMTVGREAAAVGLANGRLYAAGGLFEGILASSEGTVIHTDGTFAGWQAMGALSVARYQAVGAGVAGSFWVAGGTNDLSFFNTTERAVIDASGAITGWTAGPSMNVARVAPAVAVIGTRLYVSGGVSVSSGPPISSVEFASAVPAPLPTTVGTFRPTDGAFYLDSNANGQWDGCGTDQCLSMGMTGDIPVVGDWNGSGTTKVGTFRPTDGYFYLDYNGNGRWDGCSTDRCLAIGLNGDIPVVGDWNGGGTTKVGTFRPTDGYFYLDYNGNGRWDGCGIDKCLRIGTMGDIPLVGKW